MSVKSVVRKVMLSFVLAGRSFLGVQMSSEKIEELLHSIHQPRAEVTISDKKVDQDE